MTGSGAPRWFVSALPFSLGISSAGTTVRCASLGGCGKSSLSLPSCGSYTSHGLWRGACVPGVCSTGAGDVSRPCGRDALSCTYWRGGDIWSHLTIVRKWPTRCQACSRHLFFLSRGRVTLRSTRGDAASSLSMTTWIRRHGENNHRRTLSEGSMHGRLAKAASRHSKHSVLIQAAGAWAPTLRTHARSGRPYPSNDRPSCTGTVTQHVAPAVASSHRSSNPGDRFTDMLA